jgi:hypothetical protein
MNSELKKCCVPGCDAEIPRTHMMCLRHWNSVPNHLRRQVYRTLPNRDVRRYLDLRDRCIEAVQQ